MKESQAFEMVGKVEVAEEHAAEVDQKVVADQLDNQEDLAQSQVLVVKEEEEKIEEPKVDEAELLRVSMMEASMNKQAMLASFYELEKSRLRQIESLIPHFQQLR